MLPETFSAETVKAKTALLVGPRDDAALEAFGQIFDHLRTVEAADEAAPALADVDVVCLSAASVLAAMAGALADSAAPPALLLLPEGRSGQHTWRGLVEALGAVDDAQATLLGTVPGGVCVAVTVGESDAATEVVNHLETVLRENVRPADASVRFREDAEMVRARDRIEHLEAELDRLRSTAPAPDAGTVETRQHQTLSKRLRRAESLLAAERRKRRQAQRRLAEVSERPFIACALWVDATLRRAVGRTSGPRQRVRVAALGLTLAVLAAAMVALGVLFGTAAMLWTLVLLALGALLLASAESLMTLRRVSAHAQRASLAAEQTSTRSRQLARELQRTRRKVMEKQRIIIQVGRHTARDIGHLDAMVRTQFDRQVRMLETGSAGLPELAELIETRVATPLRDLAQHEVRDRNRQTRQIEAVANMFAMVPVRAGTPGLGGWAASPDILLWLMDDMLARRPEVVVECGSGASTLWLALTAREFGLDTRIVAVEHDPRFAQATRELLRRHGVEHLAEVRDAPLRRVDLAGHETPWYDVTAFADLFQIGLLFVDGPPADSGKLPRLPAVTVLRDRLATDCTIVLDDLIRPEEKEVAAAWRQQLSDFDYRELDVEKGAAVLTRRP